MKGKFVDFLFKRIDSKLYEIGEEATDYSKVVDLESYIDTLKEIVGELIKL